MPSAPRPSCQQIPDPGPLPEHLLSVPGFIAEVMDYNLATAFRPQPVLALAGAIGLQSVLAGRKVRDSRGNRTSLYLVGVAPSGAGKEHALRINHRVLSEAGMEQLARNGATASGVALLDAVMVQPSLLLQGDEVGRLLCAIRNPPGPRHLANVRALLTKLYSSADTVFQDKGYADTKQCPMICQPCLSIYGTTVPHPVCLFFSTVGINDGFVTRLLAFKGDRPGAARPPRAQTFIPASILEAARWWGRFQPAGSVAGAAPAPLLVERTPEASDAFDALAGVVDTELSQGSAGRLLWARAEEKARRLALVYACSANRKRPLIDRAAAHWACHLTEHVTRWMLHMASWQPPISGYVRRRMR